MTTVTKGTLLISDPFLKDPSFGRSVVLIVEKNELGTVGFVLNQELELNVADVLENMPYACRLFNGGPVAHDSLHFLYLGHDPVRGAEPVMPGLYWGGDFAEMMERMQKGSITEENLRFFVGYSGWEPGQLENELSEQVWITSTADTRTLFSDQSPRLWKTVLKSMGSKYAILANAPVDPQLN